ncbi:MAG: putative molybdenum carrier protein [Deltaproteobacteria bacterium]|nr:MAG: putative molybdenum carrier protein [Deltaproteobacteria bacterium]
MPIDTQTGADRAALDVARRLDVPHGGWIPKGRLAEDGPISDKYELQEMPTASYPKRTEQNVIDSDGTLILSHGNLTGGSLYTKECADKHKLPCLHVNLDATPADKAVTVIADWIFKNEIEVLNVTGPRASKDVKIYEANYNIINSVYWLCRVKAGTVNIKLDQPKTVDETVYQIIDELSLRDRAAYANLPEEKFLPLKYALVIYLRDQLRHSAVNKELMEDCIAKLGI